MKSFLLLVLFFLASCASGPRFKELSHKELTDYVMKESMLTTALRSASLSAPNCLRPFEANMPRPVYDRLLEMVRQHFKYDEMHASIRSRMMNGSDRESTLRLARELDGKVWRKFLEGIKNSQQMQERHAKVYRALEEGNFDLEAPRPRLVAELTDHAFMVNLIRLSNAQVLSMIEAETKVPLNPKQKDLLAWVGGELKTLNEAHIRALFTSTFLATEELSNEELRELLAIRSHEILKLGKASLEQELAQRYHRFYSEMRKITQGKK